MGSYAELAKRFAEYASLGVDTFALAAHPHLEEAYHLGTRLPRVRDHLNALRSAG